MGTDNAPKTRVLIKMVLIYQYRGSENQEELKKLDLVYSK